MWRSQDCHGFGPPAVTGRGVSAWFRHVPERPITAENPAPIAVHVNDESPPGEQRPELLVAVNACMRTDTMRVCGRAVVAHGAFVAALIGMAR
jgi:hypothetical protein